MSETPRKEGPSVTAGEHVVRSADFLRSAIFDGWRPYDPDRARPVYMQIDYWPSPPHVRRAGWYPRKPREARP